MKLLVILTAILFHNICTAQSTFVVKTGKKANYTLEIPKDFTAMEAIGANVDLKFVDKNGASINTVVKKLPAGVKESQIIEMSYPLLPFQTFRTSNYFWSKPKRIHAF